jgi:cation-transporting P-type ATPase 13A2
VADVAILTNSPDEKEHLAKVDHFEPNTSYKEHIVSAEFNTLRYCASSLDSYRVYQVREVPTNFPRFLGSKYDDKFQHKLERNILRAQYGNNVMSVPIPNTIEITARSALHPLVVFGYFSAAIWYLEDYYLYASFVLVICLYGVYFLTSQEIYNLQRLKDLSGVSERVTVIEGGIAAETPQVQTSVPDMVLIAGDRFIVTEGSSMPCDAVLISGRAVMDESMLTGESIPVTKVPIDLHDLGGGQPTAITTGKLANNTATHKEIDLVAKRPASILFAGTKTKYVAVDTVAVCYRTGFRSSRGQLIASLLNPREGFAQLYSDILLIVIITFFLASVVFIYDGIYFTSIGISYSKTFLLYFDLLTVAIPISLVVAVVVATYISIWRLKEKTINVSESSRLNLSGLISSVCFDKTGTLTEETLDYEGVIMPASIIRDGGSSLSGSSQGGGDIPTWVEMDSRDSLPRVCCELFATCHSLSLLSGSGNDLVPVGDVLEVALLKASGWSLQLSFDGKSTTLPARFGENVYRSVQWYYASTYLTECTFFCATY